MASSCALLVDDIQLTGQRRFVPGFLSGLFQESDRVETHDEEHDEAVIQYRASRQSILKRLDMMGCTSGLAEARFREWRDEEIRDRRELNEDEDEGDEDDETLRDLRALTWEEWRRRIPEVLRTLYNFDKYADEIDRHLKAFDETSWLWFDGFDSLLSLPAILDAAPDATTITLDVGDLIHAGWIDAGERVCAGKTRIVATRGQPAGPTILQRGAWESRPDFRSSEANSGNYLTRTIGNLDRFPRAAVGEPKSDRLLAAPKFSPLICRGQHLMISLSLPEELDAVLALRA